MTQELVKELRSLDFDCRPPPSCIEEAADTIERLQREREVVLMLGRECELSITGDPYEESAITTHEIAMQAIREALRLGLERNNEANALRIELAARDKTIEAMRLALTEKHGKGCICIYCEDADRSEEKP